MTSQGLCVSSLRRPSSHGLECSPHGIQLEVRLDVLGKVGRVAALSIDCHGEVLGELLDLVLVALHLDDGPRGIAVRGDDGVALACDSELTLHLGRLVEEAGEKEFGVGGAGIGRSTCETVAR